RNPRCKLLQTTTMTFMGHIVTKPRPGSSAETRLWVLATLGVTRYPDVSEDRSCSRAFSTSEDRAGVLPRDERHHGSPTSRAACVRVPTPGNRCRLCPGPGCPQRPLRTLGGRRSHSGLLGPEDPHHGTSQSDGHGGGRGGRPHPGRRLARGSEEGP